MLLLRVLLYENTGDWGLVTTEDADAWAVGVFCLLMKAITRAAEGVIFLMGEPHNWTRNWTSGWLGPVM